MIWPLPCNLTKSMQPRCTGALEQHIHRKREFVTMSIAKLYRSREGLLLGVCRGLAEYLNISVKWMRILTVLTMIFTGFFPVAFFYLLAAFFMKLEPVATSSESEPRSESSPVDDLERLRAKFNHLAARVSKATDTLLDSRNTRHKGANAE